MYNILVKTKNGSKYFYLTSVVQENKIQHIVASMYTGAIVSLPDTTELEIVDECLVKMRKKLYDK